MNRTMKNALCLVPLLLVGMTGVTQETRPATAAVQQQVAVEAEWHLVGTQNGVSCFQRIVPMGTGNGVQVRFVNESAGTVTINWTVKDGGAVANGKIVLAAGESAGPGSPSADGTQLAVRIATDAPVVSFTVSK